jgi:hypothetical protein
MLSIPGSRRLCADSIVGGLPQAWAPFLNQWAKSGTEIGGNRFVVNPIHKTNPLDEGLWEAEMLGIVLVLPILLIAATAMAQSPKVNQPPASAGSSTQRVALPEIHALDAITPAPLTDDERRQEDQRRRALVMLLLNGGWSLRPFSAMSH